MEQDQITCPVCRHPLGAAPAVRHPDGAFLAAYDGHRIEFCSWGCFCHFFQEPERYYLAYRQETGQTISRLEQMVEIAHGALSL